MHKTVTYALPAALVLLTPLICSANNTPDNDNTNLTALADRLARVTEYSADASFEVWLPSAAEPVIYELKLSQAEGTQGDSLMDCRYLIEWTLHTPSGPTSGFSSYFDGNYYRFNNNKMLEYHMNGDADVLAPGGQPGNGVQQRGQFVDLLPASLSAQLHAMATDPAYSYTLTERNGRSTVEGKYSINGETVKEFKYVFETNSALPVQLDIDTSPNLISEQNITVRYSGSEYSDVPASEDALVGLYPEAFAKYRRSNFRLESLVDQPAPEFAVSRLGGERYIHHRGDGFGVPTVIAFLDSSVGTPAETVSSLRQAVGEYPGGLQLILAFDDNRADEVAALTGKTQPDEVVLTGAKTMSRDFGVVDRPTIVLCDSQGNIRHIIVGMNKNLADEVLQQSIQMNKH